MSNYMSIIFFLYKVTNDVNVGSKLKFDFESKSLSSWHILDGVLSQLCSKFLVLLCKTSFMSFLNKKFKHILLKNSCVIYCITVTHIN